MSTQEPDVNTPTTVTAPSSRFQHQRGAALVVSMVLLMVLTLLAISTMSTASLEVTMAGNKQYSENAFQLAETGSQQYLATVRDDTALCVNNENPTICDIDDEPVDEMGSYSVVNRTVRDDETMPCPNSSDGESARFDFELQALGNAASNAAAQHTGGWFFCRY